MDDLRGKSLNEIRDAVHANAVAKGFWNESHGDSRFLIHLQRCYVELAEASQLWDNGAEVDTVTHNLVHTADGMVIKPHGVPVELADAIIRILDICGRYEIDIEEVLAAKHTYNITRPYLHGKRG